jgi:LPXTG-motif cell wall-anchored protein
MPMSGPASANCLETGSLPRSERSSLCATIFELVADDSEPQTGEESSKTFALGVAIVSAVFLVLAAGVVVLILHLH